MKDREIRSICPKESRIKEQTFYIYPSTLLLYSKDVTFDHLQVIYNHIHMSSRIRVHVRVFVCCFYLMWVRAHKPHLQSEKNVLRLLLVFTICTDVSLSDGILLELNVNGSKEKRYQ